MAAVDWLVIAAGCGMIAGILWYFFAAERAWGTPAPSARAQAPERS